MKKEWQVNYRGLDIRIENTWIGGCRLFVNGDLKDEDLSYFSAKLSTMAKNADGSSIQIKASLGGFWRVGCRIWVDENIVL